MNITAVLTVLALFAIPPAPPIGRAQVQRPPVIKKKPELKPIGLPLPDLVLTRFELAPAAGATVNDAVSVFVEITNRGPAAAAFKKGEAYVSMTLPGRSTPWKWTAMMDLEVSPNKPLTSGQIVFQPDQVPPGTYDLTAVADPDNRVSESDETNNRASLRWTIADAEKPDLVISDVYSQQVTVGKDVCLNVVVTVKNAGRGNAYVPFKTPFLRCPEAGPTINAGNEKTYKPGDTEKFIFTLMNPTGPKTLVLTVDPDNIIKESDETNNTRTFVAQLK